MKDLATKEIEFALPHRKVSVGLSLAKMIEEDNVLWGEQRLIQRRIVVEHHLHEGIGLEDLITDLS